MLNRWTNLIATAQRKKYKPRFFRENFGRTLKEIGLLMREIAELIGAFFGKLNWVSKIFSFLLVFFILFWIDTSMGFTYHYFTDRKISEISKYNSLLKDTTIDKSVRVLLENERMSVIKKTRSFLEPGTKRSRDNSLLFHISYSWIYLILMLSAYGLLRLNNPSDTRKHTRTQVAWLCTILLMELVIIYFLVSSISMYMERYFSYLVNTLIQIVCLGLTFYIAMRGNSSKKEQLEEI